MALLDSGSSVNLVSQSVIDRLSGVEIKPPGLISVVAVNKSVTQISGIIDAEIEFDGFRSRISLIVLPDSNNEVVLGFRTM